MITGMDDAESISRAYDVGLTERPFFHKAV